MKRRSFRRPSTLAMTSLLASAALAPAVGCKPPLPPSTPLAELTPQEISGYQVFQSRCASCHDANTEKGLHGPGLQGLYKKRYLPSGAPANDERVSSAILRGRGMMPGFANNLANNLDDNLNDRQLSNLIAYLRTL